MTQAEIRVTPLSSIEVTLDRPANYYLVESPEVKLLIDAGPRREPERLAYEADYVVLTHFHWDHSRGIVGLSEVGIPVCASALTLKFLKPEVSTERMLRIEGAISPEVDDMAIQVFKMYVSFFEEIRSALGRVKVYEVGRCPGLEKAKARVLSCPGHSEDHICIVIGGHAFIGDNLVPGGSITLLDVESYINSMLNLLSDASWRVAHPGHGKFSVSRDELVNELHDEILGKIRRILTVALSVGREWRTLKEVLYDVYKGLDKFMMYVASRSLVGYIDFLERIGLVEVDRNSRPWRVRAKI